MKRFIAGMLVLALASASVAFGATPPSRNTTITLVNASSEPISELRGQRHNGWIETYPDGQPLLPGQTVLVDFASQNQGSSQGRPASTCLFDFIGAVMPHEHASTFGPIDVCKVAKFVVDDRGSYLEIGGPGKGPVGARIRKNTAPYTEEGTSPRFALATDSGCLIAQEFGAVTKAWFRQSTYHWDGTRCEPGKFISGQGTLTVTGDMGTGKPGIGLNFYRGTMVDGAWDGPVNHSDQYTNMAPHDYGADLYVMGCSPKYIEDRSCFPHRVGSVAAVVTP